MKNQTLQTLGLAGLLISVGLAAEEQAAPTDQPAAETQPTVATPADAPSGDKPIAVLNGKEIPLDLFRLFYTERLRQGKARNTPAFQNQVFNEFVNILVTAQDAEKKGLDQQKNVELAVELQRLQILSQLALQEAVENAQPSDEALQKAYDERYGKEKRTEYKARHILVATEGEAAKLIDELKGGADFAELAKLRSLGPTGDKGGDLGWFDGTQMVAPFAEAVAAMGAGEHSEKPVQTQFGWHVIQLEETRESDPPPLDKVKNELSAGLQRGILGDYIMGLRDGAELNLNEELIKPAKVETGEAQPAAAEQPAEAAQPATAEQPATPEQPAATE